MKIQRLLIILLAVLAIFTLTSFTRTNTEVYLLPMKDSPKATVLKKVDYVPNTVKKIDVSYINQTEKYPNGCESVSTVMALNHLGIGISPEAFINDYLEKGDVPKPGLSIGPDPDKVYCGDPYSDKGWGCNAPVIVNALHKLLGTVDYKINLSYGTSLSDLCYDYIDRDIPVIVWVTVGMENANSEEDIHHWVTDEGKEITYNRKLHCMLLCGYDNENYYFNDPLTEKLKAYPKAETEKAYGLLGMQSIVIIRN